CYAVLLSSSLALFLNDTATTDFYTLSLHDALPISLAFYLAFLRYRRLTSLLAERNGYIQQQQQALQDAYRKLEALSRTDSLTGLDRKSTRLNSSHVKISYAVFCLKKKTARHMNAST